MLSFKNINWISIPLLILLVYLKMQNHVPIWSIFCLIGLWIILTTIGSFHIRWNFFLKSKHHNRQSKDAVIALTFDDGPHIEITPKVLDLLNKHQVKATFFCIGKHIEKNPEILEQILEEGHTIGNHSFEHSNKNGFLTTRKLVADITKSNQIVKEITGLELKLFRPPFGVTNPNIAKAIKILNLQSIGWSIRSFDTLAKNPNKVFHRIINKINNGDIILLHDTNELTLEVLVQLLPFLEKKNIKTLTIDQLLKIKAYA